MSAALKVDAVAAEMQVGRMTVYRLIWAGDLPATDVGTSKRPRLRIARADLDDFLRRRRLQPPSTRAT